MSQEFLRRLVGTWRGTCRTWFEPGTLADTSLVTATIQPLLGGRFVRHAYSATIQGRPRAGEETIAFNGVTKRFETSWIDDYHMNYALMASAGEATPSGFSVLGSYDVAPGEPPWGWRTVFDLPDADHLTITAYNVAPDGTEARALETAYERHVIAR